MPQLSPHRSCLGTLLRRAALTRRPVRHPAAPDPPHGRAGSRAHGSPANHPAATAVVGPFLAARPEALTSQRQVHHQLLDARILPLDLAQPTHPLPASSGSASSCVRRARTGLNIDGRRGGPRSMRDLLFADIAHF